MDSTPISGLHVRTTITIIYTYIYTYIYIYSISELHWLQHFSINIYLENEYLTSCFVRLLKIPFFVTPLRSLPPPQPNSWHVSREGVFLSKHIPVYGYFREIIIFPPTVYHIIKLRTEFLNFRNLTPPKHTYLTNTPFWQKNHSWPLLLGVNS